LHRIDNLEQSLQDTVALLARMPGVFNALLRDLPESWTAPNEGEGTWSSYDIVGHLIHGERTDWMPRVKLILEKGESGTFQPFDRQAQMKASPKESLAALLEEFSRLREENLRELAALDLQPEDLKRRGRHPALGMVSLSELLATWAAHDLTHLHQISRVMAHQYRDLVGPWTEYLGVMKCSGHSS
jgi:hypothetical protein